MKQFIVIITLLSTPVATKTNAQFNPMSLNAPPTSPFSLSPYNASFMGPSNGFFPPSSNGQFLTPPGFEANPFSLTQPSTIGATAGAVGGPQEAMYWSYYAIPAANPFFSQKAYEAALKRQQAITFASMNLDFARQRSGIIQSNNQCLMSQNPMSLNGWQGILAGFSTISSNQMGVPSPLCGGGVPQFGGQNFGGMFAGANQTGTPFASSPQMALKSMQMKFDNLANQRMALEQQRMDTQMKMNENKMSLQSVGQIASTFSGLMGAFGQIQNGGLSPMSLNNNSRGGRLADDYDYDYGHRKEDGHDHSH